MTTNHIKTKLTNPNHDQRHKCHHLTMTLHLTLKMTAAQVHIHVHVVKMSVTNNDSLSKDYTHPDNHTRQTTDILFHLSPTKDLLKGLHGFCSPL